MSNGADNFFDPPAYLPEDPRESMVPRVVPDKKSEISNLQSLAAGFKRSNSLASAIVEEELLNEALRPKRLTGTTDYLNRAKGDGFFGPELMDFRYPANDEQYQAVVNQKKLERFNNEASMENPVFGYVGELFGSLTSPEALPFLIMGPRAIGRAATTASAARTGLALGAGEAAASEIALQATQMDRTREESIMNIAASSLLVGVMSGGAYALRPKTEAYFGRNADDSFNELVTNARNLEGDVADFNPSTSVEQIKAFDDVDTQNVLGDLTQEARDKITAKIQAKEAAVANQSFLQDSPVDLLHGTSREFETFATEGGIAKNRRGMDVRDPFFYFTDQEAVAQRFSKQTGGRQQVDFVRGWLGEELEDFIGATPRAMQREFPEEWSEFRESISNRLEKGWQFEHIDEDRLPKKVTDVDEILELSLESEEVNLMAIKPGREGRVIQAKIYGADIDLTEQASFEALPQDIKDALSKVGVTSALPKLSYQHENYGADLLKVLEPFGVGKVKVPDVYESGFYSWIANPKAIDNPDFSPSIQSKRAEDLEKQILDLYDELDKTLADLEKEYTPSGIDYADFSSIRDGGGGSVSAAGVGQSFDELQLPQDLNKYKKYYLDNSVQGWLSPAVNVATSDVPEIVKYGRSIFETPMPTRGSQEGIDLPTGETVFSANPISAVTKADLRSNAASVKVIKEYQEISKELHKIGATTKKGSLPEREVLEKAYHAMHLGDDAASAGFPQHLTAPANKLVKKFRDSANEALDIFVEAEALPANIKPENARSYATQNFTTRKIFQNLPLWKRKAGEYFEKDFYAIRKELQKTVADAEDARNALKKFIADKDEVARLMAKVKEADEAQYLLDSKLRDDVDVLKDYVQEMTVKQEEIFANVDDITQFRMALQPDIGVIKRRGFAPMLDSEWVSLMDGNALEMVMKLNRAAYGKKYVQEAFGKSPDTGKYRTLEEVEEEMSQAAAAIRDKETDPKKIAALDKRHKSQIRDIRAGVMLLEQTFQTSNLKADHIALRAGQTMRNYGNARYMWGRVLSSLSDVFGPVFVLGYANVFQDLVVPLLQAAADPKVRKAIRNQKEGANHLDLAVGNEHFKNFRAAAISGTDDVLRGDTMVERFMETASIATTKYSGANMWDNWWKKVTLMAEFNHLFRVTSSGKIPEKSARMFRRFGLTDADQKVLGQLYKEYGETTGNAYVPNMTDWPAKYQPLADKVEEMLFNMNRSTILEATPGDIPVFMNTELGKSMMQFQSHGMASNHRILNTSVALNGQEQSALAAFALAITAGMLTETLKRIERLDDPLTDPMDLIVAGVDRSGIFAQPMFLRGILQNVGLDPLRLAGIEAPSRYAASGATTRLLGPSVGTAEDLGKGVRALTDIVASDKTRASDVNALISLMPGQTALGVKSLLSKAKDSLSEELE